MYGSSSLFLFFVLFLFCFAVSRCAIGFLVFALFAILLFNSSSHLISIIKQCFVLLAYCILLFLGLLLFFQYSICSHTFCYSIRFSSLFNNHTSSLFLFFVLANLFHFFVCYPSIGFHCAGLCHRTAFVWLFVCLCMSARTTTIKTCGP